MEAIGRHLRQGDHIAIIGIPGSGKTHLAKLMTASAARCVYFDPHGEYDKIATPTDAVTIYALAFEHARYAVQADRQEDVPIEDEVKHTVNVTRDAGRQFGPIVLVMDELGSYQAKTQPILRRLHMNGHKDNVVSVLVSQRAVDLPLGCRATLTRVYSLLQTHPDDLDRIEREFGHDFREATEEWRPGDPPAVWERPRLWR